MTGAGRAVSGAQMYCAAGDCTGKGGHLQGWRASADRAAAARRHGRTAGAGLQCRTTTAVAGLWKFSHLWKVLSPLEVLSPLLKGKRCQSSSLLPPGLSCIFCCCASPPSALPSCVLHDGAQDTKAIPHETTATPHHSWPPCPHMCRTILHRRRRQRWALAWRLRGRWRSSTVCRAGRSCRCGSAALTSCRTHRWR